MRYTLHLSMFLILFITNTQHIITNWFTLLSNVRQVLHTPTQRNVLVTSNALLVTIPMKLGFMNAKEDMTSVLRHVENALQTEPHSKQSVGTYNGLQHNFDQLKRYSPLYIIAS